MKNKLVKSVAVPFASDNEDLETFAARLTEKINSFSEPPLAMFSMDEGMLLIYRDGARPAETESSEDVPLKQVRKLVIVPAPRNTQKSLLSYSKDSDDDTDDDDDTLTDIVIVLNELLKAAPLESKIFDTEDVQRIEAFLRRLPHQYLERVGGLIDAILKEHKELHQGDGQEGGCFLVENVNTILNLIKAAKTRALS